MAPVEAQSFHGPLFDLPFTRSVTFPRWIRGESSKESIRESRGRGEGEGVQQRQVRPSAWPRSSTRLCRRACSLSSLGATLPRGAAGDGGRGCRDASFPRGPAALLTSSPTILPLGPCAGVRAPQATLVPPQDVAVCSPHTPGTPLPEPPALLTARPRATVVTALATTRAALPTC